jgi:hypothetical protein
MADDSTIEGREQIIAEMRLPRDLERGDFEGVKFILAYLRSKWAEANRIANDIVKAVRDSLYAHGKGENAPALAEWRGLLVDAVYAKLLTGGDWGTDGPNVITVATDMGTIAALLCGSSAQPTKDQLKVAFAACKSHNTCSAGGVGGGAWCSFDWF